MSTLLTVAAARRTETPPPQALTNLGRFPKRTPPGGHEAQCDLGNPERCARGLHHPSRVICKGSSSHDSPPIAVNDSCNRRPLLTTRMRCDASESLCAPPKRSAAPGATAHTSRAPVNNVDGSACGRICLRSRHLASLASIENPSRIPLIDCVWFACVDFISLLFHQPALAHATRGGPECLAKGSPLLCVRAPFVSAQSVEKTRTPCIPPSHRSCFRP